MFIKHLSFETVADLVEGKLTSDAKDTATTHLTNCTECTKLVSELSNVIGYMRSDKMEDAPSFALSNAFNIMPRKAKVETPSLLQKIAAALSFDSAFSTPAYGVRSGATAASRQMLFNAGEFDIDLRITSQGNEWIIAGQILGECSNGRIELIGDDTNIETTLNELCEFKLSPVKEGNYTLRIVFADSEIELHEIVVK